VVDVRLLFVFTAVIRMPSANLRLGSSATVIDYFSAAPTKRFIDISRTSRRRCLSEAWLLGGRWGRDGGSRK